MDLQVYLAAMTAFRQQGRCLHLLADSLALVVLGTLAGCSNYDEIADFGISEYSYLRTRLGLVLTNGVPSARTFVQVMGALRSDTLELALRRLMQGLLEPVYQRNPTSPNSETNPSAGRPRRRSEQLIVSTWSAGNTLCLGQVRISARSTEAVAVPILLGLLDCRGAFIRLESNKCSKAAAEQIVVGGGNYLLALTSRQRGLYKQAEAFWALQQDVPSYALTRRLGHGQTEEDAFYVAAAPLSVTETTKWPALRSLIMVETTNRRENQKTIMRRYYISSLQAFSPQQVAELISQNWPCAQQLHWELNFTIDEADICARFQQSLANLQLVQQFCTQLPSRELMAISPRAALHKPPIERECFPRIAVA